MVETSFISGFMPLIMNLLKFGFFAFILIIILVVGFFVIKEIKRRKWHITIMERRSDGRLHTIKHDVMIERKINKGLKTIYWLKKAKVETIPPPDDCVERIKGKDFVTYLRIERDYIPMSLKTKDYNKLEVRKAYVKYYDKLLERIRSVKTTFFDSEPVRDRFIYIPTNKSLCANMDYHPIDYDMSMMAQNQIQHADQFFKMSGEFWAKYGAYIVFALTIVFLIIVVVLTYNHASGFLDSAFSAAQQVAGTTGGDGSGAPPS